MIIICTEGLTPMQLGRLNAALDKRWRFGDKIRTLRERVLGLRGEKREWDGMCDYNRLKFNRMSGKEQVAYEARLKARRYYTVDGFQVPKIVYDAVRVIEPVD